jgi:hypothetical protein
MDALFLGLAIMVGSAGSGAAAVLPQGSPAGAETRVSRQGLMTPNGTPGLRPVWPKLPPVSEQLRPPTFRPRHVKSPTLRAAITGAVVGLFAGAAIGYAATNRSGCDTCGLSGICMGAPIGAGVGALLAVQWRK